MCSGFPECTNALFAVGCCQTNLCRVSSSAVQALLPRSSFVSTVGKIFEVSLQLSADSCLCRDLECTNSPWWPWPAAPGGSLTPCPLLCSIYAQAAAHCLALSNAMGASTPRPDGWRDFGPMLRLVSRLGSDSIFCSSWLNSQDVPKTWFSFCLVGSCWWTLLLDPVGLCSTGEGTDCLGNPGSQFMKE